MMKLFLLIMAVVICSSTVLAAFDWDAWYAAQNAAKNGVDKEVTTIDRCYNITLKIKQTDGNTSTPTFKDCTDNGDGNWYCDCTTADPYTLIMKTNGAELTDPRVYTITMTYEIYTDINKYKVSFGVDDYGNDVTVDESKVTNLGKDMIVIDKPVYINQTVVEYRDRVVNNTIYQDVIKYVDNPTTLKELNTTKGQVSALNAKNKDLQTQLDIAGVVCFIVLIIGFLLWKPRRN